MQVASKYLTFTLIFLSACAATPVDKRDELPKRKFSSIALASPQDIVNIIAPETQFERTARGGATGAAGGSLGGLLTGAAACGPYLYGLCVIGLGTAGLVAGGVAGSIYGFTGLSSDEAESLAERILQMNPQHSLESDLVSNIHKRSPSGMFGEPESAEIQAIITIEEIRFVHEDQQLRISIIVRLTFMTAESRRQPELGSRVFHTESSSGDRRQWLNSNSGKLEHAFDECIDALAEQIANALREHWSPMKST
jgi:hypothetical protein